MRRGRTFRSGKPRPADGQSSDSETLSRIQSLADYTIDTLESSFQKRQAFRAYESSVERAANQLLRIYRDANERSRRTPAPSHFREEWKLPHSFLNSAQAIELTADPQNPEPNIPTVLELRRESDALLDQYSELLKQYPHPTEMGSLK